MSVSNRPVFKFNLSKARAKLTATVDLPTPPLPLATATMCLIPGIFFCEGVIGCSATFFRRISSNLALICSFLSTVQKKR